MEGVRISDMGTDKSFSPASSCVHVFCIYVKFIRIKKLLIIIIHIFVRAHSVFYVSLSPHYFSYIYLYQIRSLTHTELHFTSTVYTFLAAATDVIVVVFCFSFHKPGAVRAECKEIVWVGN